MKMFPHYHQLDAMDCGPTCLRMIDKHYGRHYSLETLRQKCFIGREGVSLLGISTAAEGIGFRTVGVHISFQQLCEAPLPCIVHWKQNHFVVVYDIKRPKDSSQLTDHSSLVYVADLGQGLIKFLRNLPPSHTGFSPKIPPSNGLIITLKTRSYLILIKIEKTTYIQKFLVLLHSPFTGLRSQ